MFDESKIFKRPTYKLFRSLLDNYNMNVGEAEVVTNEEVGEINEFIDEIAKTEVIKLLHKLYKIIIVEKGLASLQINEFKKELHRICFKLYRRIRETSVQDSNVYLSVSFEGTKFLGYITGFKFIYKKGLAISIIRDFF